jgi:hypothetical protein
VDHKGKFSSQKVGPIGTQLPLKIWLDETVNWALYFIFDFSFYNPVHNIEGVQVDFARLSEWMSLKSKSDFENLLSRYEKFPILADEICDMLRLSIKEKRTNHEVTMVILFLSML